MWVVASTAARGSLLSVPLPETGAPARPGGSRIIVEPAPVGGTIFTLPAGRNPRAAFGLTLFTCLFASVPVSITHLIRTGAWGPFFDFVPWIIVAFSAPFALLLAVLALHTWLLSTRVTVSPGRLAITCCLLGLAWTREVACADIRDVRLKVGMQFGLTPYYDSVIGLASGRRATLSAMLRDRREAEWLAASIQRGLSGRLS